MALKTYLATLEVRVVVEVPDDFTDDDFKDSTEMYVTSKGVQMMVADNRIEDIQLIDCMAEEHPDEDA